MNQNKASLDIITVHLFASVVGTGFFWVILSIIIVGFMLAEKLSLFFIIVGLVVLSLAFIEIGSAVKKIGEQIGTEDNNKKAMKK